MDDLIEPHEPMADCDCRTCACTERNRLRKLLLWALWHNQGSFSPVGQPIRRALGIGKYDSMTEEQVCAGSNAAAMFMMARADLVLDAP